MRKNKQQRELGVTWRAILIGLILIPPNVFWVVEVECIWHSGHPTTISLFWNVVLNLFVLIIINLGIKQVWPKAALRQGEMITIYVMLSISSGLAGHDSLALTIPTLPHAYWFATPENEWADLFHRFIPEHLTVSNKELLIGYYEEKTNFYQKDILMAWLGPTLWWTSLFFALGLIMICVNVLIRKQWTEHEKLAYPIIQLPMAITERGGRSSFFRNKLLWIGFLIAALLDVWHGLAHFFPILPDFSVRHDAPGRNLGRFFTEKPWNAIGSVPVPLYPFVIGLGFLLPLDLSFSIWFFYIFRKLQFVFGSAMGMRSLPGFPYQFDQAIGAWIALFLAALWVTRRHLVYVFKKVLGLQSPIDDSDEPIRYRTAAIIIALAFAYVIFWCIKAGMTIGIILFYFGFYFAISFAITRVRAEIGPPAHEMAFATNAPSLMVNVLGTRAVGARNMTIFPYMWGISGRGYREHIMPHQLEGFKMAEQAKMSRKKLVHVMALAVLIGTIASFWAIVSELYRVEDGAGGPAIGHIRGQFNWLANRIAYPRDPNIPAVGFTIGGALFTFFLMAMRMRFIWWPFHPAGYALSMPFGVEYFWTCLIISSFVKWVTLKYGGIETHRKAKYFFFGVILGEFCVGAFWSAMSVILGAPIYDFAPG